VAEGSVMPTAHISRPASISEVVAEMDRRGAVIKSLEQEIDRLRAALVMPDADRRQWFISDLLATNGHFNRAQIGKAFNVSIPMVSLDIRRWLEENPGRAIYNPSSKRYERAA
jgi:hypothetical protein